MVSFRMSVSRNISYILLKVGFVIEIPGRDYYAFRKRPPTRVGLNLTACQIKIYHSRHVAPHVLLKVIRVKGRIEAHRIPELLHSRNYAGCNCCLIVLRGVYAVHRSKLDYIASKRILIKQDARNFKILHVGIEGLLLFVSQRNQLPVFILRGHL